MKKRIRMDADMEQDFIDHLADPRTKVEVLGIYGEDGKPLSEAEGFLQCPLCKGYVDVRDLKSFVQHMGPLPHPAAPKMQ